MIQLVVSIILLGLILLILAFASIYDIKYRRIETKSIIYLYILVPFYLYLTNADMTVASICFMLTLAMFIFLWVISLGGFGFGDVLTISVLGWLIADLDILHAYLITMGVMSIPWALFWTWYYARKPEYKGLLHGFKKVIPVDKLRPGMVKANDSFMKGFTEEDIARFKDQGYTSVRVKQPMPYIPVVFITTLIYALIPSLSFI